MGGVDESSGCWHNSIVQSLEERCVDSLDNGSLNEVSVDLVVEGSVVDDGVMEASGVSDDLEVGLWVSLPLSDRGHHSRGEGLEAGEGIEERSVESRVNLWVE